MGYPSDAVEVRSYWKVGDGDPFAGGAIGYDSTWTVNGRDAGSSTTRPAGATTITEADYDGLMGAYLTEWTARATGGQEWVDARVAEDAATRTATRAALVAGDALTEAQAASIAGAV